MRAGMSNLICMASAVEVSNATLWFSDMHSLCFALGSVYHLY